MELITKSAEETKSFGKEVADSLKGGEVLALTGGLGSGKTTFVQGLAEGLGIEGRIISPTFILLKKYKAGEKNLYHIDLYRLDENLESEVRNLGAYDIFGKKENILVIEWAEKIKNFIPSNATWISFENLGEDQRKITLNK